MEPLSLTNGRLLDILFLNFLGVDIPEIRTTIYKVGNQSCIMLYFLNLPLKGVVETKFRISRLIDPPWFITNKKSRRLFKNLTYFQINNSKINLLKLGFSALV